MQCSPVPETWRCSTNVFGMRPLGIRIWLVAVAGSLLLAACGVDEPTDFTADNRSGFMAACTRSLDDTQLVTDVCRCVFAATSDELSFVEFSSIDRQLQENPEQELPEEVLDVIAECVIEVGEL